MSKQYFKQMDGLRFWAIFLVLIEHYAIIIGRHISAGFYGVNLFFVISGFLITNILLGYKDDFGSSYKKFLGRRTLRIFPIYYLTIGVLYLMGDETVHQYLLYCLTYTYNYAWVYFDIPMNPVAHFWSLAVEEQFYLFWPFIVLALRKNHKALAIIFTVIIAICMLQLCLDIIPGYKYHIGLFPQAGPLVIGAMGALWYKNYKLPEKVFNSAWVELLMLVVMFYMLTVSYTIKLFILPLTSLFFILKTTGFGFRLRLLDKLLSNAAIRYIGTISYGVYLYHLPIAFYFTEYVFDPLIWQKIDWDSLGSIKIIRWHSWLVKFPLYTGITILLAHLSYKYFETPILKLKDKYF